MDLDENVASFTAITGASADQAQQYLEMSNNELTQAMDLFYNMGGIDLSGQVAAASAVDVPAVTAPTRPSQAREVINLDSDEEEDPQSVSRSSRGGDGGETRPSHEDDAAMARRLQEEFYGGAGGAGGADADGYRAPIAPTRETLVGPGAYDLDDAGDMHAAVLEQMRQRSSASRRRGTGRPGIFNQQPGSSSIWTEGSSSSDRHAELSRATGGASERSHKSTMLAEMFRPPFELLSRLSWDDARDAGKADQKWILVNVQDASIFDCQLLNRDLWKHEGIKETVKENFIFMQYQKDDPTGNQYMQYYFQDREIDSSYPHIAIVDPRTGEQVKVWSGPPAPKAMDFLMQLHEFLDRYSLNAAAKNPVAKRKPEPKRETQVDRMTEEEQLDMAMKASLAGSEATEGKEGDPDELTRSVGDIKPTEQTDTPMADVGAEGATNGTAPETTASPFAAISSHKPHEEPPADSNSTRIQFRHSNGRSVRRFALQDPVHRLYEWLKASPLEGMDATGEFDLVFMGKNLIEHLDETVEAAGLKNAAVNLEYT